jgi:hypothetical protein
VVAEEGRIVSDEGVENLKDSLVALLVLSFYSGLQDVDHARNEALHELQSLRILIGLDNHEDSANRTNDVDAHLLAVRILDAALEELKKLVCVVAEVCRVVFEDGIENVRTDLASNDVVIGVELDELLEEVVALAKVHVGTDDGGNEASKRVADGGSGLLQGTINEMVPGKSALVLGDFLPVLDD